MCLKQQLATTCPSSCACLSPFNCFGTLSFLLTTHNEATKSAATSRYTPVLHHCRTFSVRNFCAAFFMMALHSMDVCCCARTRARAVGSCSLRTPPTPGVDAM